MSGFTRFALVLVVSAVGLTAFFGNQWHQLIDRTDPYIEPIVDSLPEPIDRFDPSAGPGEMVDSFREPIVITEVPADIRKMERSRRAQRPADPKRKTLGLTFDEVLKGWSRQHKPEIEIVPTAQVPGVTPTTVHVSISYPGASADRLVDAVLTPLEQSINGVQNMLSMVSSTTDSGAAEITIYFQPGTDQNINFENVQNRVNIMLKHLPPLVVRERVLVSRDRIKRIDGYWRPRPKPAEPMPPTACRSVEPVPKGIDDRFSGPHRVHDLAVSDFESASGFGFVRMMFSKNKRGVWVASPAIDRVELVSLLTDSEPSVYVLDEMATPALARQAQRRPLDEFERLGLDAVRCGEHLIWSPEAPTRMFGAIRARTHCLECHANAKKGDLLGAFTYYLNTPVDQLADALENEVLCATYVRSRPYRWLGMPFGVGVLVSALCFGLIHALNTARRSRNQKRGKGSPKASVGALARRGLHLPNRSSFLRTFAA